MHRGSTDDLSLLQIFSGVVWQTGDLHMSHNSLYLLSSRLCFFIVLKRDSFDYRDDSLTRDRGLLCEPNKQLNVLPLQKRRARLAP